MYETICYEKPFLKQAVARIDFVGAVEALAKSVPTKLANVLAKHFPIIEPSDAIAQELQIDVGSVTHRSKHFKQWNFFGKEREKQLSLAADFVFVTYTRYTTYEDMKKDFGAIVDAVGKAFPDTTVGRFGLRYVNNIEIEGLPDATTWGDYIAGELLNTGAFFCDPQHLTRLLHLTELKYEDLNIRFQFGMPNPDYPAVMKRPQFILDIDAYVQTAHDLAQALQFMDGAHTRIQELFEKSITDKLRERMYAKPADAV